MSIYSALFKYRPRPSRRPLEDYLSEALADLLNRLPPDDGVGLAKLLLRGDGAEPVTSRLNRSHGRLRWLTQYRVDAGILDLVAMLDGDPLIVIESKVGAPIGARRDEDGSASVGFDQLTNYAEWMKRRRGGGAPPAALVLLSHLTDPPPHFTHEMLGVPCLARRWREVWAWARQPMEVSDQGGRPATADALRAEFATFLEENDMSADFATFEDLARAQVFIGSADRLNRTMRQIGERAVDTWARHEQFKPRGMSETYDSAGELIWAWFYPKQQPSKRDGWYIAWGIRFPTMRGDWWLRSKPPLPSVPQAVVVLGADLGRTQLPIRGPGPLPPNWSQDQESGDMIRAKPIHEFDGNPEAFAGELADWVAGGVEEIALFYDKLVRLSDASAG